MYISALLLQFAAEDVVCATRCIILNPHFYDQKYYSEEKSFGPSLKKAKKPLEEN